jgi:Holliday junction resolvase
VSNPSKQRGTAAETALLRWLHDAGHRAIRNPPAGNNDVGDLTLYLGPHINVTIEVKNRRDLAAAIRDGLHALEVEKQNAGTPNGVLVLKRRGVGDPGRWLAIRLVQDDPEIGVL